MQQAHEDAYEGNQKHALRYLKEKGDQPICVPEGTLPDALLHARVVRGEPGQPQAYLKLPVFAGGRTE